MKRVTKPCVICGTPVTRVPSQMTEKACCSAECTKKYISQRLSNLNKELNPGRMTPETREKLRLKHLGKGEGKTYTKTYQRHTHRIVAEQKLGRPLRPGEIVHHKDENILNNHPDNIEIFASQAEHARHHALKNGGIKRKK